MTIGDEVTIKSGVFLWDGIVLKDRVFVGPNVTFMNDLRPRSKAFPEAFLLTVVEEWASIGANASIVGGRWIGRYAMIGAGAVVTRDVPAHALWYGNSAVFNGYVCECGNRLVDETCPQCRRIYIRVGDQLLKAGDGL